MFKHNESTTYSRPNKAGRTGTVVCLYAHEGKTKKQTSMVWLVVAFPEATEVNYKILQDGSQLTSTPKKFEAMGESESMTMFGVSAKDFQQGMVYSYIGGVLTRYYPTPEENKPYEYKDSMTATQVRQVKTPLSEYIFNVPFERRSLVPSRDLVVAGEEYATDGPSRIICMQVVPESMCNDNEPDERSIQDDWFPSQPNGSVWCRVVCGNNPVTAYRPQGSEERVPCFSNAGGESGSPLELYIRQRDENGVDLKLNGSTIFYEHTVSYFQSSNWDIMAPYYLPYMQGSAIGTVHRAKTLTLSTPDESVFHASLYLSVAFVPDMKAIAKEMGIKVSAGLAEKLVKEKGAKAAHKNKLNPSLSAVNLCTVRVPGSREEVYSDEKHEYYVIGSHGWTDHLIEQMDQLSDDEKFECYLNKNKMYAWPKGKEQVIDVFAVVIDSSKDAGEDGTTKKMRIEEEIE